MSDASNGVTTSRADRFNTAALCCGLVPLAIGTSIFVLWWLTRREWLLFAGLLTILGGVLSVLVGLLCLCLHAAATYGRQPILGRMVVGLVALLVNFPAAFLIVIAVATIGLGVPHAYVFVGNDGPDIDRLTVDGACDEFDFGSIAHGEHIFGRRIEIKRDGDLTFHVTRDGKQTSGLLAAGVRQHTAPTWDIDFAADGTWPVEAMPGAD